MSATLAAAGSVSMLRRYPVKSMLGEDVDTLSVDTLGAAYDRRLALIDVESGRVASAKQPRLWRKLLQCTARVDRTDVVITLPDGRQLPAQGADGELSTFLGREVTMSDSRFPGAEVERPDPERVLEHGVEADIDFELLELSMATPGSTFVDHSPLHIITTATLDAVGAEALRYRPNIVIETPRGTAPFNENAWLGSTIRLGDVRTRATIPTPRCCVPTLEHGELGRAPHALRVPVAMNMVEVEGFGVLPCAGIFLQVVEPGAIAIGDIAVVDAL